MGLETEMGLDNTALSRNTNRPIHSEVIDLAPKTSVLADAIARHTMMGLRKLTFSLCLVKRTESHLTRLWAPYSGRYR